MQQLTYNQVYQTKKRDHSWTLECSPMCFMGKKKQYIVDTEDYQWSFMYTGYV